MIRYWNALRRVGHINLKSSQKKADVYFEILKPVLTELQYDTLQESRKRSIERSNPRLWDSSWMFFDHKVKRAIRSHIRTLKENEIR